MPTPKQASRISITVVSSRSATDIFSRSMILPTGTTVERAIHASGVLPAHGIDFASLKAGDTRVGIYGKLMPLDAILVENDRIEIHRPVKPEAVKAARQRHTKEQ